MKRVNLPFAVLLFLVCGLGLESGVGQQVADSHRATVPALVKFGGTASDPSGKPLNGPLGITFAIYKDQQGGAPLWLETQSVPVDKTGHYSVSLGVTKAAGLPADIFVSGDAKWLGVQIEGQSEQSRVLLLSVPYALKAGDAETIGGLPPSAFVLAAPTGGSANAASVASGTTSTSSAPPPSATVTGTGTVNFLPLWDTASDIVSSAVFQSGTGTAARIGINTTTPGATLDVRGSATVQGLLTLPALGAATAAAGRTSRAQNFVTSSFNSGTSAAVNQFFQWKAEPAGNNTASPSGTLNLLFGSGTVAPAETGLKIASNGQFTFAAGQTFPGAGTITGVTTAAGSGLTGGGTTGNLTLSLLNTCAASQILQWNGTTWACAAAGTGTITGVTAGTGLSGGGTSGNVTLSLNTGTTDARYAQLGAANAFTKNNSFAGTVGIGTATPSAQLDVEAPATAATGILGVTSSTGFFSAGVFGHATGTSGVTRGVYGVSDSPSGIGVHGIAQIGGQFETGTGTIFVGRGQGATRVTIDSLGNTSTSGSISAGGALNTGGAIQAGGGFFTSVTAGTTAVFASSDTGTGVFGSGGIGVLGDSTSGDGVHGINGSGASGVAGINNGGGQGLYGAAMGSTGQGVHGESFATGAVNGFGPDGVDGITHSANGSGVAGLNDALGGTGVYGVSTNGGFGFQTPSNVQQARGMGGWAKAMAFVDPFASGGIAITRCFNSQASGATVWTPPCGISISHLRTGDNVLDFGFQVSDRYVSATISIGPGTSPIGIMTCSVYNLCSASANQLETYSFYTSSNLPTDSPFWVIIF